MSYRKEIEKKIERKRQDIAERSRLNAQDEAFIAGLSEALKLAPPDDGQAMPDTLREGSDMAKVRDILRLSCKPLHVDEIVMAMDKEYTDGMKVGLAGSLSSYAKKRKVFTKTAPKTFGLIEFEAVKNATFSEVVETFR